MSFAPPPSLYSMVSDTRAFSGFAVDDIEAAVVRGPGGHRAAGPPGAVR
jgi:hypothetical protein